MGVSGCVEQLLLVLVLLLVVSVCVRRWCGCVVFGDCARQGVLRWPASQPTRAVTYIPEYLNPLLQTRSLC